jgi:probable phosphomutase (TIGR03848 family)
MTTFLLIRHAHTLITGNGLAGRQEGHHLSEEGCAQALQLAEFLQSVPIAAVYSSPLVRACETAQIIANAHRLQVQTEARFNEIDYGHWTGQSFEALHNDEQWQHWNRLRSLSQPSGGESMLSAQTRALSALLELHQRYREGNIAVVSHADIVKAMLAYLLGIPLDLFGRIEIAPASISAVRFYETSVSILCVNHTRELTL